jgi:hypothetical protein
MMKLQEFAKGNDQSCGKYYQVQDVVTVLEKQHLAGELPQMDRTKIFRVTVCQAQGW